MIRPAPLIGSLLDAVVHDTVQHPRAVGPQYFAARGVFRNPGGTGAWSRSRRSGGARASHRCSGLRPDGILAVILRDFGDGRDAARAQRGVSPAADAVLQFLGRPQLPERDPPVFGRSIDQPKTEETEHRPASSAKANVHPIRRARRHLLYYFGMHRWPVTMQRARRPTSTAEASRHAICAPISPPKAGQKLSTSV